MQQKLTILARNGEPDGAVLLQNFTHDIEVLTNHDRLGPFTKRRG